MKSGFRPLRELGFTLLEAIIVIAITGVLGTMVAVFIKTSVDGYVDAERRAEMTDAADGFLRRLTREVRLALPNSLRVTDDKGSAGTCAADATTCYIEFIPTRSGGRYRAPGDGSTKGSILDFTDTTAKTFDVVGPMPSPLGAGNFIVVYNLGPGFSPADAYRRGSAPCDDTPAASGCNIAAVSAVGTNSITLDANPFAYEVPPLPSPNNRFQVVPSTGPVSYACSRSAQSGVIRYTGYGFATTQPTAFGGGGTSAAIAAANATCEVDYSLDALTRTGVLYVRITLTRSGESVSAFREIHVDNSP